VQEASVFAVGKTVSVKDCQMHAVVTDFTQVAEKGWRLMKCTVFGVLIPNGRGRFNP
jgi:hypothetical protein